MQMCFTKKVCITCHKGQSFWDPCKCANPRSDWPPNSLCALQLTVLGLALGQVKAGKW